MIFIMVVLLLIFGAKRLPELGGGLGKGIREFKKSMREINTEIEKASEADTLAAPRRPAVTPPADAPKEEPRS
jgi:sec-independent protein translocase protein TatA